MTTILADGISKRIISMKDIEFWYFTEVNNNSALIYIDLDNGLSPIRAQAIIWTNAYPIHWCIYAALRG